MTCLPPLSLETDPQGHKLLSSVVGPPPPFQKLVSLILNSFWPSCTNSARPIGEAARRHLWPSRRVTVENFSWGPVGKTGSGRGRMGRALENLVQSGPQVHPLGPVSTVFTRSTVLAGSLLPSSHKTPDPLTLL